MSLSICSWLWCRYVTRQTLLLLSAHHIRNGGGQCIQDDVIKVNLCSRKEEGVTEDEARKNKKISAYFSGDMGSCAPQGLMHTNPNSEVTVIFSTVPESFEMKPIADVRK